MPFTSLPGGLPGVTWDLFPHSGLMEFGYRKRCTGRAALPGAGRRTGMSAGAGRLGTAPSCGQAPGFKPQISKSLLCSIKIRKCYSWMRALVVCL